MLILKQLCFGGQRAFENGMLATDQTRKKAAGLVVLLLSLIALNLAVVCAAAAPIHPCCPASSSHRQTHCAKLGCFMADPAILVKSQVAVNFTSLEIHPNGFACTMSEDWTRVNPLPILSERSLRFHQLLI